MTPDTNKIAARMRAGLDGVTGELWAGLICFVWEGCREREAQFLALCGPDNIAAILDDRDALKARVKDLEEGLRPFALPDTETGGRLIRYTARGWNEADLTEDARRARTLLEDRSDDR